MKKSHLITVLFTLLIVTSCKGVPTISEGPAEGEDIKEALNIRNFDAYLVQSNHFNESFDTQTVAQALITEDDMRFITKTRNFLAPIEISYYYLDNLHDGKYDVYYKEKKDRDSKYLGNSYYQGYNLFSTNIGNFPNVENFKTYYNVYDMTKLNYEEFTYITNRGGWYRLNEDAYKRVIAEFFGLDNTVYNLDKFEVQVEKNHINSLVYSISDKTNNFKRENELFYIYQLMNYLNETQYSLINNIEVKPYVPDVPEPDTSETPSEEIPSETSETPSETPSDTTSDITSDTPLPRVEGVDPVIAEVLSFSLYNDYNLFQKKDAPNVISKLTLAQPSLIEGEPDMVISELIGDKTTPVRERELYIYDTPLVRGERYRLRLELLTGEYYDYSFIH
jgi:hypothetical protein